DHMGVHEQRQPGLYHVGVPVPVGIADGGQLVAIADLADELGGDVRLTKQQNLIVTGVPEARLQETKDRLGEIGFDVDAHPLAATAIACTGEPHCNYSVAETKGKMQELLAHLESRWGDRLGNFKLNLDGCPHACSLHWVGDIGLMGTTARETVDGTRQAYDLFLRGGVGPEQGIGRPLVRRVPTTRVPATLDTGRLPQETYELVEKVHDRYGIRVEMIHPEAAHLEGMVQKHGPNLMYQSVDMRLLCCQVRKVLPLNRFLHEHLDAWVTGLRRDQWASRAEVRKIEIDHYHFGIAKVNPLADWTKDEVWTYIRDNDVPSHSLYDQGYTSIGCAPCTRPIAEGE